MDAPAVGDLAFDNGIRLHELTHRAATLEEAFLEATEAAQEYQAQVVDAVATQTEGG
jgi:ABC-2 type transport system ATP-binding protein